MKNKIQEVQEYFKNKILTGKYEVIELNDYIATFKIDNEFIFSFWVASGDIGFKQQELSSCYPNFIYIPMFSDVESVIAYTLIKPVLDKMTTEKLDKEKLEQYNNLQTELKKKGLIND